MPVEASQLDSLTRAVTYRRGVAALCDRACLHMRVTSPEALRRQADAVAAVRRARTERDESIERLNQAIKDAADTGALYRDIALAAGLTRQRISQIVRGE